MREWWTQRVQSGWLKDKEGAAQTYAGDCQGPNFYLEYGLPWILTLLLKPTEQTTMHGPVMSICRKPGGLQEWILQHQHHLQTCTKCQYPSPTADPLNQNLWGGTQHRVFNKPSRWSWGMVKVGHTIINHVLGYPNLNTCCPVNKTESPAGGCCVVGSWGWPSNFLIQLSFKLDERGVEHDSLSLWCPGSKSKREKIGPIILLKPMVICNARNLLRLSVASNLYSFKVRATFRQSHGFCKWKE